MLKKKEKKKILIFMDLSEKDGVQKISFKWLIITVRHAVESCGVTPHTQQGTRPNQSVREGFSGDINLRLTCWLM